MKKIYLAVFLICLINTCYSQTDNFYFYKGKKVNIDVNKELIYTELSDDIKIEKLLSEDKTSLEEIKNGRSKNKFWKLIKVSTDKELKQYESIKNKLRKNKSIVSVSSVVGKKVPVSISGSFYVKLKKKSDYTLLEEIARKYSCQILRKVKYMPKWYALSAPKNTEPLNMANDIFETGYFEEIDPGFDLSFSTVCVDDDNFDQQWGLSNVNGIDINACEAWDISRGSENVIVAVVDQGIDMNHSEFTNNILPNSFNALTNTTPADVFGDHGTHVAGIIGANQNNNQVSGVAPLTSLMSVSHSLIITDDVSEQLASGISWAWQNGADVINNSWGDQGGAYYNDLQSALLESAIDDALSNGRNRLGCIIVFAAGNHAPAIDYPGSYTSDIICVGSIDRTGVRASSSGYGNELDIVAPGVSILSTIRNNRVDILSGTSMAAPHVAGVAALILSVNPNLTQDEVRNLIESTCTKVGNYNYTSTSGRINGTWDDEVGYGLVNAAAAVEAALPTIDGSTIVCNSGNTYSLNNLIQGVSVTWSSSPNITFPSGNTGASVTAKASSSTVSGTGWIEATLSNSSGDVALPRKEVWVGKPLKPTQIFGDIPGFPNLCTGSTAILEVFDDNLSGNTNYQWNIGGASILGSSTGSEIRIRAHTWPTNLDYHVTPLNQCGTGPSLTIHGQVKDCGGGMYMAIAPNPANEYAELTFYSTDEISDYQKESKATVSLSTEETEISDLEGYEVQLWHERKGLVKQMKSKSKKLQIPTNNLDQGIYFLHVIVNGKVHKQQLKIKR